MKVRRLKRRPDFLAAAAGRRFHTERMTAQGRVRAPEETRGGETAEGLHVGFTVTKRVGHATERNRIRRRLRGAVDRAALDAATLPADVVIVGRRPLLDAPFAAIVEDLRRAFGAVTKPKAAGRQDRPAAPHSASDQPGSDTGRSRARAPRVRGASTRPSGRPARSQDLPHGSTDG